MLLSAFICLPFIFICNFYLEYARDLLCCFKIIFWFRWSWNFLNHCITKTGHCNVFLTHDLHYNRYLSTQSHGSTRIPLECVNSKMGDVNLLEQSEEVHLFLDLELLISRDGDTQDRLFRYNRCDWCCSQVYLRIQKPILLIEPPAIPLSIILLKPRHCQGPKLDLSDG